ncbi:MAG: RidA family protein [Myxococcota bacterium]
MTSLRTCCLASLLLALGLGCATSADPPRYHASAETRALGLPFSDAVEVGRLVLLSGQIGNRPGSFDLVPGGIAAESRQALENVRAILEDQDLSMRDVVKCTVFLADIADWPAFNDVYVTFFEPGRYPARSALAASGLAVGARVEVECIAARPGASR